MDKDKNEDIVDNFVRGIVEGTLRLPEPLCKKCGDWGGVQRCENESCKFYLVKVYAGFTTCEGCKIKMIDYFCLCSALWYESYLD